ncbi:hypothetical protein IAU60_005149 [Kwoniella sp. DSM 27419]
MAVADRAVEPSPIETTVALPGSKREGDPGQVPTPDIAKITDTQPAKRTHSDSVSSKASSVHFDLDVLSSQPMPVKPSLRSQQANPYQPSQPSHLHTSTIPSPPKSAPLMSTNGPFPNNISGKLLSPASPALSTASSPGFTRISLPSRRSSQDRRVWSESLPPSRTHRSGSLIAQGRRASRVTGGFETSSDEEGVKADHESGTPGDQSHSEQQDVLFGDGTLGGSRRPRSKSLLSPGLQRERQGSDASGSSRDPKRRRGEEPRRVTRKESDRHRQPMPLSTTRSTFDTSPARPSVLLPSSKSESMMRNIDGSPRSLSSRRLANGAAGRALPSIQSQDDGKSDGLENRSGTKGKQKDTEKKLDSLASSLGLGLAGSRDMALTSDQLYSLLSDSDVSSALRMMNTAHAPASRPPQMNDWNNSVFFSPPITRQASPITAGSAPKSTSPYLVSAPPALTKSEDHGRERTMSVASSVAPPTRSTWGSTPTRDRRKSDAVSPTIGFEASRRRASSKAGLMDGQGGHIPFTHHVTAAQADEGDTDTETGTVNPDLATLEEVDSGPQVIESGPAKDTGPKEKERKGRFSGLFSKGKKRATEVHIPEPLHHQKEHKSDRQKAEEKAREKERYEKDLERRRLEQERRDEELAQERRFRALNQVAAHPASERIAYRTGAHFRAYYQHVYDGIEDPPKLNPLAVLRWRIRTDEQNAARTQWERAQREAGSGRNESVRDATVGTAFGAENMHNSPMSMGSTSRSAQRKSIESAQSSDRQKGFAGLGRSQAGSDSHVDLQPKARGWKYSVEDIASYKAANGVVNYFIAPRQPLTEGQILAEEEEEDRQRSITAEPDGESSRRDDASSVAGSSRQNFSAARSGYRNASNVSLMEVDESLDNDALSPLSRSASNETGKGLVLGRSRLTHRSHQSLSALGQGSISHALKQPFEKLSHVAKKRGGLGGDRDEPQEENTSRHASPHQSSANHRFSPIHKGGRLPPTPVGQNANPRLRDQVLFRRQNHPAPESVTDEEGNRDFHLRKLFLKGQRVFGSMDEGPRSGVGKKQDGEQAVDKHTAREQELIALEAALMREAAFRERQAEASRQTQLEVEAQERIKTLENEIYAERAQQLEAARDRLDPINSYLVFIDESIKQYVMQIDFLQEEARVAADIVIQWDSVDAIRPRYVRARTRSQEAEQDDKFPALRSFDSPYSGSETPVLSLGTRRRSQAQVSSSAMSNPKRRSSLFKTPAPRLDAQPVLPLRHRPRRTYLDPTGKERVDPTRHAELAIALGKERLQDMGKEREDMKVELERMIAGIEGMIKQKDAVRHWARDVLERNHARQAQLDQLLRQETSVTRFSLIEWRDPILNAVARILGWLVRSTFWMYYQAKAEVSIYLTPFKLSTYCRSRRSGIAADANTSAVKAGHHADGAKVAFRQRIVPDVQVNGNGQMVNSDERSNGSGDHDAVLDLNLRADDDAADGLENRTERRVRLEEARERRIPVLSLVSAGVTIAAVFFFYYGA